MRLAALVDVRQLVSCHHVPASVTLTVTCSPAITICAPNKSACMSVSLLWRR